MNENIAFYKTICRFICKPYKEHISKTLQEILTEHGYAFVYRGEIFGSGDIKPLPKHLKNKLLVYLENRKKYRDMVDTIFIYMISKSGDNYTEFQKCLTPTLQENILNRNPMTPHDDIPQSILAIYKQMELLSLL